MIKVKAGCAGSVSLSLVRLDRIKVFIVEKMCQRGENEPVFSQIIGIRQNLSRNQMFLSALLLLVVATKAK